MKRRWPCSRDGSLICVFCPRRAREKARGLVWSSGRAPNRIPSSTPSFRSAASFHLKEGSLYSKPAAALSQALSSWAHRFSCTAAPRRARSRSISFVESTSSKMWMCWPTMRASRFRRITCMDKRSLTGVWLRLALSSVMTAEGCNPGASGRCQRMRDIARRGQATHGESEPRWASVTPAARYFRWYLLMRRW